jgi:uridine kinase
MTSKPTPLVVAIAGGSGSGKTTVANTILREVGADRIAYLPHDAYYRDLSSLPLVQRVAVNFDHPNSLESELMMQHIRQLKNWEPVEMPVYDFTRHTRTELRR